MEPLMNEFTVHRSIEQTWTVLTDVERIAPCMKGAELQEIEGDTYRGVVKLKLGPISTQFKGQAHFVSRDDVNHIAVLKGEGRDTGGKGNAEALITASLHEESPGVTKVKVTSDIKLTGKVAQFGRLGVIRDTSEKLMTDFAHNLNTMLESQGDVPVAASPVAEPVSAADAAAPVAEAAPADAPKAPPTVRKINGPAAEPIELSDVANTAMMKKALPFVGGLVLLLLILRRLTK
ncbi:MAG: SRPBCC family protein [Ilumatobacteraceae bacterium]|nr:SRPBCC family protein [Ilumatobacteraceae bacterium]